MLTIQVKNNMLHLNGQNLSMAAKNGHISKTPGLHLSATHGNEAVGQLTASSSTQQGTAQLDLLLLKPPRLDLEREAENQPTRRPLKLAPLELPQEVREAQKQKLKLIQQEPKPASCILDGSLNEPQIRKGKSYVKQKPKPVVCTSVSTKPLQAPQQNGYSRPQLTRSSLREQNGHKQLEDVVCRGTPAPLSSKPAPPLLCLGVKVQTVGVEEVTHPTLNTVQQETGSGRLRLRRAHRLKEDQCNPNTSTGGLSADEGKLVQGVQGKGQRAERPLRGQLLTGKGIKELPAVIENGSIRKSLQGVNNQQPARYTLSCQPAESVNSELALDDIKPNDSNWRLKKKTLITRHKDAGPMEKL